MRTLYLHIGHGKTGTSYLQSCFARSRKAFSAAGICYPTGRHDRQAADGGVSSGNGGALAKGLGDASTRERIARPLRRQTDHVLFSSEYLFHHMAGLAEPDDVLDFADRAGCDRVAILMLIRDPLDHIRSAYLQNVQRAGQTDRIDAMATRFNMPQRANKLARVFQGPRITMTILNYSRMKSQLIAETEAWLGLSGGALDQPPRTRVNRSLTAAEMEMQRVFNARYGPSGGLFADHVVETLPDLQPEYPMMSVPARRIAHDRCAPAMHRLNQLVPEDQAYRFDLDPDGATDEPDAEYVTMTEEQIDEIVAALARRISR